MIGSAAYERSFEIEFHSEDQQEAFRQGWLCRVLPSAHRIRLPINELAGKSVAIVGNGNVVGAGRLIDQHEEVLRINLMRRWRQSPTDDGERITMWTGHPAFMVDRDGSNGLKADERFTELVKNGIPLWALSPFHITCDSHVWLRENEALDRLIVAPPPYAVYEIACKTLANSELSELFSIPQERAHIVGLPRYDLLLSGTRLALLLEMSDVKELSVFGCDLFASSTDPVWFGHELAIDRSVLLGIKERMISKGRNFYWHEESPFSGDYNSADNVRVCTAPAV